MDDHPREPIPSRGHPDATHPVERSAGLSGDRTAEAAPQPGRRRLWQLPPEHRALVVGLAWAPATLRALAEQALGRLHRVKVELQGSDADVLASVLHDLGSRNPLSEALQRALERRHAAVQARCAGLREAAALRSVWQQALADGSVPGTLWALLTHPLGPGLEDALLIDSRAWLFAQARTAQALAAARAQAVTQDASLRAQVQGLQQRLLARQAEFEAERLTWAREQARLRGERDAWEHAARAAQSARTARTAAPAHPHGVPPEAGPAVEAVAAPVPDAGQAAGRAEPTGGPRTPDPSAPTAPATPSLHGRRVLCVGGMPGAQSRYRQLVETAGARFDFHDGGLEQGLHRLDRQLLAADLVVCQAGCLNHEAYRRVKAHCRQATKPCLFAERPSLAHFARTLGLA